MADKSKAGSTHDRFLANWSIRPNPERGRIIRKPEGQNIYKMAKQLDNGKAEFDHKAE